MTVTLVALLIFGPKRLPEVGGAIGKSYQEFKKALSERFESTLTDVKNTGERKENLNGDFEQENQY